MSYLQLCELLDSRPQLCVYYAGRHCKALSTIVKCQDDNVEGQEAEEESKTEDPSLREFTLTLSRCFNHFHTLISLSPSPFTCILHFSLSLSNLTLSRCFDHFHYYQITFTFSATENTPLQALISPESDAVRRRRHCYMF